MGKSQGRGQGEGPGGKCTCPGCGHKTTHARGIPCTTLKCPKCGANMVREGVG